MQTYRLKQKKKSFNIETIFYLTTQKSTPLENFLNYTLLQDLKLFKIAQNNIKIKALIYTPSKNN